MRGPAHPWVPGEEWHSNRPLLRLEGAGFAGATAAIQWWQHCSRIVVGGGVASGRRTPKV